MASGVLGDLRSAYLRDEPIVVADLPGDTQDVVVVSAVGAVYIATVGSDSATVSGLPDGTHVLQALSSSGDVLAEEFFSVRGQRGEDPVLGFVTSFDDASRDDVLAWLRDLRCTVVQVYDWMDSYSTALAESDDYEDPLGRPISRRSLESLTDGIKELGAVAQAYAPVIAAGNELASAHPNGASFETTERPSPWATYCRSWIRATSSGSRTGSKTTVAPRTCSASTDFISTRTAIHATRSTLRGAASISRLATLPLWKLSVAARPNDVLSFNQVNGVPRGFWAPAPPSFRYVEVWPPNDRWRHLEGLLARSGSNECDGSTLALYPPVWGGERTNALRTCVLSEAVSTVLGANVLIWGDDDGVLCHPYYVNHETLKVDEREEALRWHRFALRCRDLFRAATDTSWYELSDENASVKVSWAGETRPEPDGGSLFVRVFRDEHLIVVSLIDLSGSDDGSWLSATKRGTCTSADVEVLLDSPESWLVEVAVLGRNRGRFETADYVAAGMREGVGIRVSVSIDEGWSVLRLTPKTPS